MKFRTAKANYTHTILFTFSMPYDRDIKRTHILLSEPW